MVIVPQLAQTAPFFQDSFGWLVASCILFVIGGAATYIISRKKWISTYHLLTGKRRWRILLIVVPNLAFALLLPMLIDRSSLALIRQGQGDPWLFVAVILFLAFAWSQIVGFIQGDELNEEVETRRTFATECLNLFAFAQGISRQFLGVVRTKEERIAGLTRADLTNIDKLQAALAPMKQLESILQATHTVFQSKVGVGPRLNVTLFERKGDHLQCLRAWDGQDSTTHVRERVEKHKHYFDLKADKPMSVAAFVAVRGTPYIVYDPVAENEDDNAPFRFFDTKEDDQIGSLLCLPIRERNESLPLGHVICVSTDKVNVFEDTATGRKEVALIAENIVGRLIFELQLRKLFDSGA